MRGYKVHLNATAGDEVYVGGFVVLNYCPRPDLGFAFGFEENIVEVEFAVLHDLFPLAPSNGRHRCPGDWEGFGPNYELPNDSAYAETCAAIANALWNYRMFLLRGEAKYVDVFERVLYNGLLSGIALSGGPSFIAPRERITKVTCWI